MKGFAVTTYVANWAVANVKIGSLFSVSGLSSFRLLRSARACCAQCSRVGYVGILLLFLQSCGGGSGAEESSQQQLPTTGAALPEGSANATDSSAGATQIDQVGPSAQSADSYPEMALTALTDEEFSALLPDQQYRVVNKLLATLYGGITVDEYFDLNAGLYQLKTKGAFLPSDLHRLMAVALESSEKLSIDRMILGSEEVDLPDGAFIESSFQFSRDKARELPLARIYSYPVSRDKSSLWMAWHLANTILFSPATELESVGMTDVQNIVRRLDSAIHNDIPIRETVYEHMRSVENWRRFRSPEDNTREMLEIFLGMEDLDSEVPAASAACQDWYLTDESDGYQLSYTDYPNQQAQTVLEQSIVSCNDFYTVVANHDSLVPTVAKTLVSYFFSNLPREVQGQIVQQLVQANPATFRELFIPIIFSRTYLLESEKVLGYEELFLGTAKRIGWRARENVFMGMVSGQGGSTRSYMSEMAWPAMSRKIGRQSVVPTDSLSFANYHKGFREDLVMRPYHWARELGVKEPEPPEPPPLVPPPEGASEQAITDYQTVLAFNEEVIASMSDVELVSYQADIQQYNIQTELYKKVAKLDLPEFIDYLFLTVSMRRAQANETETLIGLFDANDYLRIEEEGAYLNKWTRESAAQLVMDYLTRLPETYYHQRTGE